jgi:cyclopropane fatty-acyl-phospholipid synthase-like methyltransferase
LRCEVCRLIFVPREYHLSSADEKAEYDLHENSPDTPGYRRFLSRLFEPVNARLEDGSKGLDFGSGPGPTLSVMFEEAGHDLSIYDPFYAPDQTPLTRQHDFVTASEVVEHFRNPAEDLQRLWSCVKPGGLLGIMTKQALDQASFAKWHYRNDPTHISFFSRETFEWLATKWLVKLTFIGSDVVLFLRK